MPSLSPPSLPELLLTGCSTKPSSNQTSKGSSRGRGLRQRKLPDLDRAQHGSHECRSKGRGLKQKQKVTGDRTVRICEPARDSRRLQALKLQDPHTFSPLFEHRPSAVATDACPIARFPDDILLLVFRWMFRIHKDSDDQGLTQAAFALSHVCRVWRSLAVLDSPLLWTSVTSRFHQPAIIRTQLERARRSGNGELLPLDVKWSLHDRRVKAPRRFARDDADLAGLRIIFEDAAILERVRSLDLIMDKDRFDICFFSWDEKRMPILESSTLCYVLPYHEDNEFGNVEGEDDTDSLDLELDFMDMEPWYSLPTDASLSLFSSSPNLRSLTLRNVDLPWPSFIQQAAEPPAEFGSPLPWPSLTHLSIKHGVQIETFDMMPSSAFTLQKLLAVLSLFPALETLRLSRETMAYLVSPESETPENRTKVQLPLLRTLRVETHNFLSAVELINHLSIHRDYAPVHGNYGVVYAAKVMRESNDEPIRPSSRVWQEYSSTDSDSLVALRDSP